MTGTHFISVSSYQFGQSREPSGWGFHKINIPSKKTMACYKDKKDEIPHLIRINIIYVRQPDGN
jgi:hypothetical protein